MGSGQQGENELGGGRSSSSGSSRRGKKSSMDRTIKQPQRGLGVAQLEKIRIQSQMMSNYSQQSIYPAFPNNITMVGYGESRGEDITFGDTQFCVSPRFHPNRSGSVSQTSHFGPVTLPLMEDFVQRRNRNDRSYSAGSNSQVSDSSNLQELDLELKLSI
ncbi:protein SPEAR3-like [Phalaenopsis equestris]|uniref:protein SPEAR3-like n=1 Tax=Phalaenopsis equestris TaxID=78828 RepID=UPI0009E208EF|nr:protein SPEAR3-like [Phalaenopsis equestris]